MSSFEDKYAAAVKELERTEMWPINYAPPVHRMLRKLGLRVRPPSYQGFWQSALSFGVFFGVIWGLIMWVWEWRNEDMSLNAVLLSVLTAGGIYGVFMALWQVRDRAKWRLSRWEDL